MAIVATLWLTNVGVSVWGKSIPPSSYGASRMRYQHHVSLGISRVNTRSPLLWIHLAHSPAAPFRLGRRFATMRNAQHGQQQTTHSRRRHR